MKYIECKHSALVRCKYKVGSSEESVSFYPFVLNKYTGQPSSTGFTGIEDEVFEALKKQSRVFNNFVQKRVLIVHDELPMQAHSPATLLAMKDKEIMDLKSEIALLTVELEKAKKAAAKEPKETKPGTSSKKAETPVRF